MLGGQAGVGVPGCDWPGPPKKETRTDNESDRKDNKGIYSDMGILLKLLLKGKEELSEA